MARQEFVKLSSDDSPETIPSWASSYESQAWLAQEREAMRERKTTTQRLEALSDGIFAVILTIMVLDLKPPNEAALGRFSLSGPPFSAMPSAICSSP